MALVAVDDKEGRAAMRSWASPASSPTRKASSAEFAVMVRSDMKGRGLGFQLMKDLLASARKRGVRTVHGDVLAENTTMLAMAAELGFVRVGSEAGVVKISIDL